MPNYTSKELKEWVLSQSNFEELYNNWVKSNYNKDLTPSIDRIKDDKGYSFDNIQLVTWYYNNNKQYKNKKNGENQKNCLTVIQYSKNNEFIKEYYSIHQAERETNIASATICLVCQNKGKTAGGYIWKYK